MLYLYFWLIFALLAGAIAETRGNSAGSGFLCGLLLGPLGILIVLRSWPNIAKLKRRQRADGELDRCPLCSEMIRPTAIVCRHCGRDIPTAAPTP